MWKVIRLQQSVKNLGRDKALGAWNELFYYVAYRRTLWFTVQLFSIGSVLLLVENCNFIMCEDIESNSVRCRAHAFALWLWQANDGVSNDALEVFRSNIHRVFTRGSPHFSPKHPQFDFIDKRQSSDTKIFDSIIPRKLARFSSGCHINIMSLKKTHVLLFIGMRLICDCNKKNNIRRCPKTEAILFRLGSFQHLFDVCLYSALEIKKNTGISSFSSLIVYLSSMRLLLFSFTGFYLACSMLIFVVRFMRFMCHLFSIVIYSQYSSNHKYLCFLLLFLLFVRNKPPAQSYFPFYLFKFFFWLDEEVKSWKMLSIKLDDYKMAMALLQRIG